MGGKNIHNATSMVFSAHSIIFKPQHYEKINLINLHRIDNGNGMPGARGGKKRFNSDFKISSTAHTSGIKGVF